MSLPDWGPPADTATGPALLVHLAGGNEALPWVRDCVPVASNPEPGIDNQETGAVVLRCVGTTGCIR
jgi:hypothetical protein